MISGGDFPLNFRSFQPFQETLRIDLDKSSRGPLPNASSQPIPEGNMMTNDMGSVRLEEISSFDSSVGKVMALRVRASSEVEGLFGKKGGGWSDYCLTIEETGLAYAQKVIDEAKNVYGDVYRLDNPRYGGAGERALEIAVEIVAAHEGAQVYQSEIHPFYPLANWLVKNPLIALTSIPKNLLDNAKEYLRVSGSQTAFIDIDHDDTRYEPGITIIHAHKNTRFASFDAVKGKLLPLPGGETVCLQYQSEVNLPEYGQTPPRNKNPEAQDPLATRHICLTESGVQVFDPQQNQFAEASTSWARLGLNASIGLVALGNLNVPFPLTQMLKEAIPQLKSDVGKMLPGKDQIEWDPFESIGSAAWGGG